MLVENKTPCENSLNSTHKKGFSLIETVIAIGIFALFVMGIYGGIQMVIKVVYQSRVRIIETAVLNEQVEIIRNLSFYDVGIVNGSPSGVLERVVTTTRNGIDFEITKTIRNIDDPFDGVIGGEPNDIAPADYKFVDISILCLSCSQNNPVSFQTFVSPKFLEGDPTHGALFIEVFDAEARPVQGASVHIISTSTDPQIDLVDTTDNDGMVKLLDLAAAENAYNITITKDGYTSDGTSVSSIDLPNPIRPPASVVAQDVVEVSFSIDEISSIELSTIDALCQPVGNVPFNLRGVRLIGTEPDVVRTDLSDSTDGIGNYVFSPLEWDLYGLAVTGYDIIGSIPHLPHNLLPGNNQIVKLIVGSDTNRSLLVVVKDSVTSQPVANAEVNIVSGVIYDETKTTGIGSVRQTDWSGGSGQEEILDYTKYWSDDEGVEVLDSAGDVKLFDNGGENYVLNGQLESSIFYFGDGVNYVNLIWEPIAQDPLVGENSVRWQLATSASSSPEFWDYFGPDGTVGTYYDSENFNISNIHDEQGYFRYKLFLNTENSSSTPIVSDLSVIYTNSCTPPGQVYFGDLSAGDYTVTVTADGYQDYISELEVTGDVLVGVNMMAE